MDNVLEALLNDVLGGEERVVLLLSEGSKTRPGQDRRLPPQDTTHQKTNYTPSPPHTHTHEHLIQ